VAREIKFRGKRIDNGELVYGDLRQIEGHCCVLDYDIGDNGVTDIQRIFDIAYEVIPETVGQFTGLLDKNGKDIYEGDLLEIVDYPGENYYVEIAKSDDPPHNFIWGYRKKPEAEVRGISDGLFSMLEEGFPGGEVIGNIHDHPHLLEVS
jgi:uncharacterized phage protein (TIGR01671 family)